MSDPSQTSMQTPQDLFIHELSAIHSAEQIIVTMLEEAQGLVQTPQLQDGLRRHAEESRQHAQRVAQVLQQLGEAPHPVTCHSAQGLQQEPQEALGAQPAPPVVEGLVVAGAAKTEHLEIAAYTGLVEKARAMGQAEAVQLLAQNLQEEQQMLQQVEQIARQLTQEMAQTSSSQ